MRKLHYSTDGQTGLGSVTEETTNILLRTRLQRRVLFLCKKEE